MHAQKTKLVFFYLASRIFLVIFLNLLDGRVSKQDIVSESTYQSNSNALCSANDKSLKRRPGSKSRRPAGKWSRSVKVFVVVDDTFSSHFLLKNITVQAKK